MNRLQELILTGLIPPERVGSYVHLPFDVPPGTDRIDVHYSYDSAISAEPQYGGGNTIDIGIFDARGIGDNSPGFRGWSGSDRSTFFLASDSATPGYLVGPILPGTWNICLGVYKVAPQGCHYTVTVQLWPGENSQAAFAPLLSLDQPVEHPPVGTDGWYRGELHCHSVHSDGDSDPRDVIARAQALGLDFLAMTDHNVRSHWAAQADLRPEKLILIPGYEVTTYRGHWNIWGGTGWVDFRIETLEQMHAHMTQAAAQGYLVSCNHPYHDGSEWLFHAARGFQCVEVWNGPWPFKNHEGLDFWEARLRRGERLTAVGGSDMHRLGGGKKGIHLATPTNWVYCQGPVTAGALLDGLRAGHVFLSEKPAGPQLYLSSGAAMMGDAVARPADGILPISGRTVNGRGHTLEIFGANGCLDRRGLDRNEQALDLTVPVPETPYVRAQIRNSATGMIMALTNPIYLR